MGSIRGRYHVSNGSEAVDDPIATDIPLNDLHQPDPAVEDLDREPGQANRSTTSRSLFVRGLGTDATSESLTAFFSQSFLLKHATVVLDPSTKQSKGYGFVTLADPDDIQRAQQELDGARFGGKKLRIAIAEPRQRIIEEDVALGGARRSRPAPAAVEARTKRKEKFQPQNLPPPRLIIRNLPFSLTNPEELELLFRKFGKIKYVDLPKTPAGKPAGYGFVTIRGRKNAEKALAQVNGQEIGGRTLAVDWAVDKDVWELQKQRQASKQSEVLSEKRSDALPANLNSGDEGVANLRLSDDDDESIVNDQNDDGTGADDISDNESQQPQKDSENTLFVRNLPFSVTDEDLYEHFRTFGPLRYARVVMDHTTGYSRGTGFVCFHRKEDATSCCRGAPRNTNPAREDRRSNARTSLLENTFADSEGQYTLEGRVLNVARAVDKSEATRLSNEGKETRSMHEKDKRRLYLLSEGTLTTDSPLYEAIPPAERKLREDSAKQRQALIKGNPTLHLSLTRLSIRNIPRFVTSKDLKALAREAVVGFAMDVKAGRRAPLSKEELARGGEAMKIAEHARKVKGKGIVKQAKVVFESREGSKVTELSGSGRSRGYGFIEYATHRSALMGLRFLNGHRVEKSSESTPHPVNANDKPKRLIVEFAIENVQVMSRRREREQRSQGRRGASGATSNPTGAGTRKIGQPPLYSAEGPREAGTKRKRGDAVVEQPPKEGDSNAQHNAEDVKMQQNRIIGRKRAKRRHASVR